MVFFFIGDEILVITLDEPHSAAAFLTFAPGKKQFMNFFLVAGQGNPEVKNITQKDYILLGFFNHMQHLEKAGIDTAVVINMRICNNNHGNLVNLKLPLY